MKALLCRSQNGDFMSEEKDELAEMFPGKTIEIKGNNRTVRVTIYPMAVMHFRRFKDSVTKAMEKLGKAPADGNWEAMILPLVVQIASEDLLDIVSECVEGIDLKSPRCPSWVYPTVVTEWILESFGSEDKIRPWVTLLEQLAQSVGGQKVNLWQTLTQRSSTAVGVKKK